jgi:enolase
MSAIVDIVGREILIGCGKPDRRMRDVLLESGDGSLPFSPALPPAPREAIELRADGDKSRYPASGVLKAVEHINNEISGSRKLFGRQRAGFPDRT